MKENLLKRLRNKWPPKRKDKAGKEIIFEVGLAVLAVAVLFMFRTKLTDFQQPIETAANDKADWIFGMDDSSGEDPGDTTVTPGNCDHEFVMTVTKEPTYTEDGIATYTCSKCGGTRDNQKIDNAGFYDENDKLVVLWDDSGIDIENDYTSTTYKSDTASGYSVMNNAFTTAKKVVLPDGITKLGDLAFEGCTNLTDITLKNNLKDIGDNVFSDCRNLTALNIPNSVTSIGNYMINGCDNLKTLTIGSGITELSTYHFANCNGLKSITIPKTIKNFVGPAFYGCKGLETVNIEDGVTGIGHSAFDGCANLKSVTIPNSVKSIESYAFKGCKNIPALNIPNDVNKIGDDAFADVPHIVYTGSLTGRPWGCTHTYEEEVTKGSTCVSEGIKTYKCMTCGDIDHAETIAKTNHNYTSSITKSATCTENGVRTYKCTMCGHTYTEAVKATGHSYGTAAYTWDGYDSCTASVTCTKCGHVETISVNSTKEVTKEATCTESGTAVYTAKFDSPFTMQTKTETVAALEHNYVLTSEKVATCTEAGHKTYTCSRCKDSYTENEDALGHNYKDGVCSRCGDVMIAGLYDKNNNLLCKWEDSGIDITKDYGSIASDNSYTKDTTSGYYIINNKYKNTITIILPDGLTKIGNYAMAGLPSIIDNYNIKIPNTVNTIGDYSFFDTYIGDINIPASVVKIGNRAFGNGFFGGTVSKITVDSDNKVYDSRNNCNAIIETASNTLLYGSNNSTIPDGVQIISDYAFYGSFIKKINIPSSVTKIGKASFASCMQLETITVDSNNGVYDSRNNCNAIIETASNTLLYGSNNSTIPNGIVVISDSALASMYKLKAINIPNSVTSIGSSAFRGCNGLTTVIIPDSVTELGVSAFSLCAGLETATVGSSVTSLNSVFSSCKSLKKVTIRTNKITYLGHMTFSGCTNLESVNIPSSIKSIGWSVFDGCTNLTLTVPSSVTSISSNTFKGVKHVYYTGTATGSPWGAQAIN